MNHLTRTYSAILGSVAALAIVTPGLADLIRIDPRASYFHTDETIPDTDTIPIDLSSLSWPVNPGDFLRLESVGDFDANAGRGDVHHSMIAVFSSSSTLLSKTNRYRVPGAIKAGIDCVMAPEVDIPEDFLIADDQTNVTPVIQVPPGARFLFVCPPDWLFSDNRDPDGDYAVRITSFSPPLLTKGRVVGQPQHFSFDLVATPGLAYRIEYALSLPSTNWVVLTNVAATSSPSPVTDETGPVNGYRFYRAVVTPVVIP